MSAVAALGVSAAAVLGMSAVAALGVSAAAVLGMSAAAARAQQQQRCDHCDSAPASGSSGH